MILKDQIAIVTGGGRGIGRAIAFAFAEAGADVGLLARTQAQINDVATAIQKLGRRAAAVSCDIVDSDAVVGAIDRLVQELGGVDILVNNAGGGTERTRVGDDDVSRWRQVVEVNLMGTYQVTRAVLPHLRKRGGGRIINVGSGMGHEARPDNSSYNVAKAGVWMLTRCLALELWNENITVNELVPGPVATELTEGIFEAKQPHPKIPSEWVKQPSDVAPLALFLASQGQRGPTGQSFSLTRR